jgi:two-component system, cell cycle sensor histidine kinase and response regulator CckA
VNPLQTFHKATAHNSVDRHLSGRLETVLLVEDETFVRQVASEILECEGYRVLKARNAADARSAFRRHGNNIRLLLTDVVLPGENGYDLAVNLRTSSPGLLVIFISGYFENLVTRKGLRGNGTFYLAKPFSAELLIQKVAQVLSGTGTGEGEVPTRACDSLQPV